MSTYLESAERMIAREPMRFLSDDMVRRIASMLDGAPEGFDLRSESFHGRIYDSLPSGDYGRGDVRSCALQIIEEGIR